MKIFQNENEPTKKHIHVMKKYFKNKKNLKI
jgi:hypothetical protein